MCRRAASGTGCMSWGRSRGAYTSRLVAIEPTLRPHPLLPRRLSRLRQILLMSRQNRGADKHRRSRPDPSSSRAHFGAPRVDVRCVEVPFHVSGRETVRTRQISTWTATHVSTIDYGSSNVTRREEMMPRALEGGPVTSNGAPAAHRRALRSESGGSKLTESWQTAMRCVIC